jgi:crotonobetainyl-CoA:carnitine CoA-transferase CaiB-like acyl-CoA transferase
VVDFSALWAGPLCAHLLGLLGADVVKVETPQRPDGARGGNAEFYRLLHAGHRSVVLDPGTAAGRRAMAGLVEAADIVIEASRPRALARFGLDAEAAARAGTIWVSITAYGRGSDRVGFGDDVAAANGLVALGEDGTPYFCGDAIADPLTGLVATELARSAPANGRGALFDLAMADVVASTLDAALPGGAWTGDFARPRRRTPVGTAPAGGEHTGEVLRELGMR